MPISPPDPPGTTDSATSMSAPSGRPPPVRAFFSVSKAFGRTPSILWKLIRFHCRERRLLENWRALVKLWSWAMGATSLLPVAGGSTFRWTNVRTNDQKHLQSIRTLAKQWGETGDRRWFRRLVRAELREPNVKPRDGLCLLAKVQRCTVTGRQSSTAPCQISGLQGENNTAILKCRSVSGIHQARRFDRSRQRIAERPQFRAHRPAEALACHLALFRLGFSPPSGGQGGSPVCAMNPIRLCQRPHFFALQDGVMFTDTHVFIDYFCVFSGITLAVCVTAREMSAFSVTMSLALLPHSFASMRFQMPKSKVASQQAMGSAFFCHVTTILAV